MLEHLSTNGPPEERWRYKTHIRRALHLRGWLGNHDGKHVLTLRQSG